MQVKVQMQLPCGHREMGSCAAADALHVQKCRALRGCTVKGADAAALWAQHGGDLCSSSCQSDAGMHGHGGHCHVQAASTPSRCPAASKQR